MYGVLAISATALPQQCACTHRSSIRIRQGNGLMWSNSKGKTTIVQFGASRKAPYLHKMMRIGILSLSLCFMLNSSAQIPDYFEEAQTWTVIQASTCGNNFDCACHEEFAIYVDTDTTIGAHSYKRIGKRGIRYEEFIGIDLPIRCSSVIQNYDYTYAFLRQAGDSIFQYLSWREQLLVSYNLQVGDTVTQLYHSPVVDFIDTVQLNGSSHRRFIMGTDTLIEGFMHYGYRSYFPLIAGFVPDGIGPYDAVCFTENDSTIWLNPRYQTCDQFIGLSVQDQISPVSPFIYPNPASDWVQIRPTHGITANIRIYNLSGAVVLSASNVTQLDLSQLPVGTYFLEHRSNNVFRTRLVIAR